MSTVTSSDGTTIAFDRSGDGPPLIVVGGALSDRGAVGSLATLLTPRFTVYGYDRRGRGGSGDTAPYSVDREIDDLDALVAEAGGDALVYGHSSGAVLALEATARGVAISRLAVYEPPYLVDDSRPHPPRDLQEQLHGLAASGARSDALRRFLTTAVDMPESAVDAMQASPAWPAMEELAHTLEYDVAIVGHDMAIPVERLATIRIPTLVVDGGASPPWIRSSATALAAAIPDARHVSLEGQTHGAAPEVLVPVLIDFFS